MSRSNLQCVYHHCAPLQIVAQLAPCLSSQAVFNCFIQPSILSEQLHKPHIHMSISWPCRQFLLKQIKELVPTHLALAS